jgi:hypothetical protein
MAHLAAFPKCYLDDIIVHKSMTILEWIELAASLGVDGLEMHTLFFEAMDEVELERVKTACRQHRLDLPMMCFSPDFTHPDPDRRQEELKKQKRAIDLTVRMGGRFCRTLTGQDRPGLDRQQAIRWCVEMIRQAVEYAGERGIVLNIRMATGNTPSSPCARRSSWRSSGRSTHLSSGLISIHPMLLWPAMTRLCCCAKSRAGWLQCMPATATSMGVT